MRRDRLRDAEYVALTNVCCAECTLPEWRHDWRDEEYDGHEFEPENEAAQ